VGEDVYSGLASSHARELLGLLGVARAVDAPSDHPALGWRRAGLMDITGHPDGPGLVAPVALTAAADGALAALKALAPAARLPETGGLLLGERARLLGLGRQGALSPNKSCRLLAAADARLALNLPREEDWAMLPALLGQVADRWEVIARLAAGQRREDLLAQGRILGLAIAPDERITGSSVPLRIERTGPAKPPGRVPRVVDLSSLWAGPLAGSLLLAAGAEVIKVESRSRPDGTRAGKKEFYDLLNGGKASVAFDFTDAGDVRTLQALIASADIVLESTRPRALAALGIRAEDVAARGATWVSITAHGRVGAAGMWIGFGDDAAVAGGLSAAMAEAWNESLIAGDAIADPLTGITAALAGWASWLDGGGRVVSLALADVVAHACSLHRVDAHGVRSWQMLAEADLEPLYALPTPLGRAHDLGADNAALLSTLSV
jgi:crotonobetainyl-CoA:carnitine CoA-transferase CaiB-like acyl-CoA transferase